MTPTPPDSSARYEPSGRICEVRFSGMSLLSLISTCADPDHPGDPRGPRGSCGPYAGGAVMPRACPGARRWRELPAGARHNLRAALGLELAEEGEQESALSRPGTAPGWWCGPGPVLSAPCRRGGRGPG